jgi:hypothetical protein
MAFLKESEEIKKNKPNTIERSEKCFQSALYPKMDEKVIKLKIVKSGS